MSNSSVKTAVVGLGNVLCRDDAVGIKVLEALKDRAADGSVVFLDYGQASTGLIPVLPEYDRALLIDAIDAGLPPGDFRIFKPEEVRAAVHESKTSSHEMSLADLLGLVKTLGITTDVRIAGIQVKDISYGLEMTDEISAVQASIVERIEAFLSSWGRDPS